jgi:hypothetical protein
LKRKWHSKIAFVALASVLLLQPLSFFQGALALSRVSVDLHRDAEGTQHANPAFKHLSRFKLNWETTGNHFLTTCHLTHGRYNQNFFGWSIDTRIVLFFISSSFN